MQYSKYSVGALEVLDYGYKTNGIKLYQLKICPSALQYCDKFVKSNTGNNVKKKRKKIYLSIVYDLLLRARWVKEYEITAREFSPGRNIFLTFGLLPLLAVCLRDTTAQHDGSN